MNSVSRRVSPEQPHGTESIGSGAETVLCRLSRLARQLGNRILGGPLTDAQRERREQIIAAHQRENSSWGTEPGQHPFTFDLDEPPYYKRDQDRTAA